MNIAELILIAVLTFATLTLIEVAILMWATRKERREHLLAVERSKEALTKYVEG